MGSHTEPWKGKDTVCFGTSQKQNDTVRFGFFCGFLDPLGCRVAGPEGEGAVAGSERGGCMTQ